MQQQVDLDTICLVIGRLYLDEQLRQQEYEKVIASLKQDNDKLKALLSNSGKSQLPA